MRPALAGLVTLAALAAGVFADAVQAGAPQAFRARGEMHGKADGESQDVAMVISFKGGKVRVETDSKEAGKSIIIASKGQPTVAMLDPGQKLVVRMKASALKGPDSEDTPSVDTMLDPAAFRARVLKEGRRVGPGGSLVGHPTTIYERNRKGSSMRIWLADDLDLPLKIQGHSAKGDRMDFLVTSLDIHPSFARTEFDAVPPGYSEVKAEGR